MPSFPLGSFTWVPADSYNYIDIYTAQAHCATKRESPARVLESSKLLKQKKVLLDVKKSKKKKKRANHYDELCLQYQYAQQWLNKRNSQVSVRLTKSELKVFIKWFGSRMSKFQKADGIDVAKVSEDFVKHKIFDTEADALAFLDKVDADGNGALSYEEFCEGVENMNDYLTVMLLKKFIHSLKSRPQDYHSRNTKEQDKYGKLISERMMKKGDVEPAHTTTKKASIPSASNTSVGDIATAATVVKTNLPGGGVMFTHISARKRADPVASLTVPTHAVSNSNNNDGGPSTHKKSEKKHGHFPLMRSNTMMSTMGGKTNSIKKNSLFLDPSSDAMIRESALMMSQGGLMDLNLESEAVLEEPSMLSSVSAKYGKNKTSEEDIAAINRTMNKKLANFMTYRQMSFEEKENLKSSESNDFLASTVNDESLVLEDMSSSPSSPTYRSRGATVAWGDEGSIGSPGSPESPKARGFKNRLVGAIARSAMKMNS